MTDSKNDLLDLLAKILAVLGFIVALMTYINQFAAIIKDTQALRVASIAGYIFFTLSILWLAFRATHVKQVWRWAGLALLYFVTIFYFIWVGTWTKPGLENLSAALPNNLTQRLDFENGLPQLISLGVCDHTQTTWYDACHEAPQRLKVVEGGLAGKRSLACEVEISPDKAQVYTIRFPIDPPVFVDALSTDVYVPDADAFSQITLAAKLSGEGTWVFSDQTPRRDGWLHLLTDLQRVKEGSELAVDEIHIDVFIEKGAQEAQEERVLVGDIELYYPLAQTFKTGS